jgi:hypothetical protein
MRDYEAWDRIILTEKKPNYSKKSLSQDYFFHYRSFTDWSRIDPGSPW